MCVLYVTLVSGLCLGSPGGSELHGFEAVAETDEAVLYVDPQTTVIAVECKVTGDLWFSSPPGERMPRETFSLSYFLPGGSQGTKSSYTDSVSLGQFAVEEIEGGVRIRYDLGRRWRKEDALPVLIEKSRFEELILNRINDKFDRELFLDSYYLLTAEPAEPGGARLKLVGIDDISTVLGDYTLTLVKAGSSTSDQTKAAEALLNQIVSNRQDLRSKRDLRYEQLKPLLERMAEEPIYVLSDKLFAYDRNDMITIINEIGYTGDDASYDHEANYIDPPAPAIDTFSVTVQYVLDRSDLVVSIPMDDIEYPRSVLSSDGDRVTYSLDRIDLLRHFGAAGGADTGYMLVPDGTGALIYLNSGKDARFQYRQVLYGQDNAVPQNEDLLPPSLPNVQSYLPVFGMKKGNQAFVAIIEQGDTYACINATVASQSDPYNCVYSSFAPVPTGLAEIRIGDGYASSDLYGYPTAIRLFQTRPFTGEIRIRYCFLHGEDASYAGMAQAYRRYLDTEGTTRIVDRQDRMPVFVGVVGAIHRTRSVLGRPAEVIEPLTRYSQVTEIVSDLLRQGVRDLGVVYYGWMQGGITHSYPNGVDFEPKLGTPRDFTDMVDHLQESEVRLYPSVDFLYVSAFGDTLFDGFWARSHASRTIDGLVAVRKRENRVRRELEYVDSYVLSPRHIASVVDAFLADYTRYGVGAISLNSMGSCLNSDLRLDDFFDREHTKAMVIDQLVKLRDRVGDILVHGANGYVLPYVDTVVGVPYADNGLPISDRRIPFYQMVIHGYVDYCGDPINLSGDPIEAILRCIETGSSPYFILSSAESQQTKDSEFDYLYSIGYSDWASIVVASYNVINDALGDLRHLRIVDHEELSRDVYQTSYEDGTRILVNYGSEPVHINGIQVDGRSFRKVR